MDHEKDPGWQYLRQSRDIIAADQSKPYDSKKDVWIPDDNEGYISAQIKSEKDDTITVVTAKGNEMNLKKGLMQEMNPPKFEKTEDMSNLSFLNDASVLHNLRQRYFNMLIYTYSGLFCIVINPYKRLPIYTESVCKIFMGKRRNEVPPHLFAVSDEAYRNMLQDNECQSMLITGESGAGKTENTKKVIAYFAMVGASQQAVAVDVPGKKKVTLEDQIVQTNPVLEAFGNAKTVRNNNSSRFGKFIRIHFNGAGKLTGCDIEHYLLEKSRVVRQAPGERSYHIFYQIMSGHNPKLRADLELNEELIYYHNVSQAELKIDGVNDQEEFQMTDEAFDILKFSPEEKRDVYRLCSSMLHMGEMKFKQRPREEQAEADGTDEAEKTCRMLGDINHEEFLKALTKPRVKVGNDWVNKGQNLEQVNWSIGALVKGIYARIFDWLVRKCNQTLEGGTGEKKFFIGVLDIAGFETFDLNSFEQLWINFVNEKLQQFFNHHMFVLEQEEYAREGINWVFIDFGLDLAATIELIERPLGIISMLDEECIVPKATDLTYAQKLIDQHLGKHPKFTKPKPPKGKQGEAHFALIHYAGTVRYNVINWLEKNKDPLNDTAVGVMKTSKGNALLQTIWADYTTQEEAAKKAKEGGGGGGGKKGKSASMMTVSSMYRESLNKLMTMLHTTHPHFIRCIIPNERKTSGMIEAELVLNQLTCNGVLEGIRICRKGFPNRMVHNDFRQRYSLLAAEVAKSEKDPDTCARKMLDQLVSNGDLNDEQFRHGKTKVFFKAGVLAHMEDLRDAKLSAIMIGLQAKIRYYTAQLEYRRRQEQQVGLLVIQRNIRSWCTLRTWEWFKLYGAVKPMLKAGKEEEEMGKLQEQIKGLEDNLSKEEKLRQDVEGQCAKLMEEKNALFRELESAKGGAGEAEQVKEKLAAQKKDLEKQLQEVNERLTEQEERGGDLQKMKKKLESDCDMLKKNLQDMELSLRKSDSEKGNKDVQIRSLQEDMARQDESIAKLNKEKKQQEEINRKLTEELQAEENKVAHVGKVRSKLEQTLDEIESNFEREKHVRQDIEKAKRKLEGELKAAQENINELNHIRHDLEGNLKKKESELMATTSRLEDESTLVARLQRQVKEEQIHVKDVEDELENERQNRAKSERAKSELQRELEELSERLDEAGGATSAQLEVNKKREAEMARLRRDLEEGNMQRDLQLSALKKKHNDAVAELSEQLEQMNKSRAKLEKEKQTLQKEMQELQSTVDADGKGKGNLDRLNKQLQLQLNEIEAKCADQNRQLQDFVSQKARLSTEVSDLGKQLEDAEQSVANLTRLKAQMASHLDSTKIALDEETRERQNYASQCRTLEYEVEQLKEQLESEVEARNEVNRQLSKANSEIQQWRVKFETEGMSKAEELEESKRKLVQKLNESHESLEAANARIAQMEKNRLRSLGDLDDAQNEAERANAYAQQMEKKQKQMDKVIEEWRKKVADLENDLSVSQREARSFSTDVIRLKSAGDEQQEMIEALRRENKTLAQEIKDFADQLGEDGRSFHETQKMARRLENEKEELQTALDEAEAALEAEESKVIRSQIEVTQIRQQIEKRIHEKEEEFENTRRNHHRALESMQASLESETKGKNELLRVKKKLESDINDLEIALDHANRANSDCQKNLKKHQEQIRELQMVVEDEQRTRNDIREQYMSAEKRNTILQSEKEELATALEQAERAKKQMDIQVNDIHEQLNELTTEHANATATKRRLESEAAVLKSDLDEALSELHASDDRGKKAAADAARLAEELRAEQEHAAHSDRLRKAAESTVKELQSRLDEAGAAMLKGGQKTVAKLEARTKQLEQELEAEQRRAQESNKNSARLDRRIKELHFQADEDKKNRDSLQELIDQLQQKVKVFKKQAEDADEIANLNLQKYKSLQQQLDDALERADFAESALSKMRSQSRSASVARSPSRQLLSTSSSSVARSSSRSRLTSTK